MSENSKTDETPESSLDIIEDDQSSLRPVYRGHGYLTDDQGRPLPGSYAPWSKLKYRYQDHPSQKP